MYLTVIAAALANSSVRTLSQQEELPLLRDHLLRLDRNSRRDRFHGFMDDSFIERYAEKCANDGTIVIAFFENGVVRGAAELHPPDQSPDSLPEIAFSVESSVRRRGVGSILFRKLITEARAKGYKSLRITTGTIDLTKQDQTELATTWADSTVNAVRTIANLNRAYWRMLFRMYGWGRAA
jgi:GNAT superfamily N-acetyltransferase